MYKMNSMLGALVGDAAGATLEFCGCKVTEEMAQNAMKMPGGGRIRAGPGQITDDGELTLSLWRALNVLNNDIPTASIIKSYQEWYESIPFDMGRTCSLAFEVFEDYIKKRNFKNIDECKKQIRELNMGSEANGALMRATAIPTWAVKNNLDIEIAIKCSIEDASLSHPSLVCQEVNIIYVFAIYHLLRGISLEDILKLTDNFVNNRCNSEKVKDWYFKESLDISTLDATKQIGHVRWGFVMAIYFLRNPQFTFEEAIKITLMKGGDTDTNAAIVGGMVGSYRFIPDYMKTPVLEFDCTQDGFKHHKRPAEYSVKKVIGKLI